MGTGKIFLNVLMPKVLEQERTILAKIFSTITSTNEKTGYTTHINLVTEKLNKKF